MRQPTILVCAKGAELNRNLAPCSRCGCTAVAWDGLKKPDKWVCGRCRNPLRPAGKKP
jgi:hypothetical protein